MEFRGRIFKVMPVQSGISQNGNAWTRHEFIFEYFETPQQRYADRVLLSMMGEKMDLKEGDEVVIGYGMHVREYNGRYYNEPRVYKCEKVVKEEEAKKEAAPVQQKMEFSQQPVAAKEEKKDDDLPF